MMPTKLPNCPMNATGSNICLNIILFAMFLTINFFHYMRPLLSMKLLYIKNLLVYEISAKPLCLKMINGVYNTFILPPEGPVYIYKSSPQSSENQTSYTSSVEFGIEGNIGYSGAPNAAAGVHLNLGHSRERTIKDVNIYSKVQSGGHHAKWIFELNNLAVDTYKGNAFSHSCFQPYVQWIWRVDRAKAEREIIYFTPRGRTPNHPNTNLYFSFDLNLKGTFSSVKKNHNLNKNKEAKTDERHKVNIDVISNKQISIKIPPHPGENANTHIY